MAPQLQGSEVVPHHKTHQQNVEALSNLQQELLALNGMCKGSDEQVKAQFKKYDFNALNQRLHKDKALDEHVHACGVFKIDGKYQLIVSNDLYKGQVATVDPLTGKVDSTFTVENKGGRKLLSGHSRDMHETTQADSSTKVIVDGAGNPREYDTPCGNKVKIISTENGHRNIAIQDPNGNAEAYIWNANKGVYEHKVPDEQKGGWTVAHMQYKSVDVKNDGTVVAIPISSCDGYDSVTVRPGGGTVDMLNGLPRKIVDKNGGQRTFEWNGDTIKSVTIAQPGQPALTLRRQWGMFEPAFYDQNDCLYHALNCDAATGEVSYEHRAGEKVTISPDGEVTCTNSR